MDGLGLRYFGQLHLVGGLLSQIEGRLFRHSVIDLEETQGIFYRVCFGNKLGLLDLPVRVEFQVHLVQIVGVSRPLDPEEDRFLLLLMAGVARYHINLLVVFLLGFLPTARPVRATAVNV